VCIVDCRKQSAAFANGALGGGYESAACYGGARVLFMDIENIHVVRDCHRRLFEVCQTAVVGRLDGPWRQDAASQRIAPGEPGAEARLDAGGEAAGVGAWGASSAGCGGDRSVGGADGPVGTRAAAWDPTVTHTGWLSRLQATGWLEHVHKLLLATRRCVELVAFERTSLLVHCSDGWDRTSQLSCLVQLMLDPYFRTMRGFAVLIEKEWCGFGHPFDSRVRHGAAGARRRSWWENEQTSPIFVQWIDAVWQLTRQFPSSFEFTGQFLAALLDELHACRFGTFLGNCHRGRWRLACCDDSEDDGAAAANGTVCAGRKHGDDAGRGRVGGRGARAAARGGGGGGGPHRAAASESEGGALDGGGAPGSIRARTPSLWSELLAGAREPSHFNPLFVPAKESGETVLLPDPHPIQVQLWTEYFLRHWGFRSAGQAGGGGRGGRARGAGSGPALVTAQDLKQRCTELQARSKELRQSLARTERERKSKARRVSRLQREASNLKRERKKLLALLKRFREAGVVVQEDEDAESVLVSKA
jgi:hypothetical protein